jgi:hypothetical protein
MPDPIQQSVPILKPYLYIPPKAWLDVDLKKRDENGDVYITSHFWTTAEHKVETFGGPVIGDEAQYRLRGYFTRRPGVCVDRRARDEET